MTDFHLKRAYDPPGPEDGARILVDRLWPRGLSRAAARVDAWCKQVAPSHELRHWFGHDVTRWPEFRVRYEAELASAGEALAELEAAVAGHPRVTLVFAARDREHNNAVVLRDWLTTRGAGRAKGRPPSARPGKDE